MRPSNLSCQPGHRDRCAALSAIKVAHDLTQMLPPSDVPKKFNNPAALRAARTAA
jgi:hypothetical protein